MAIGLTLKGTLFDKAALENKELLPQKRKKVWKPTVTSLKEEMDRRKQQLGLDLFATKLRSQALRLDWLVSNPIVNKEDIAFVTKKMEHWIELNEQNNLRATEKGKEAKWKGIVPFLRFIHCLTDCDDIRNAFLKSLTCKTRVELDGKHNDELMRKDPWVMVSDKWNDPDFFIYSQKYPHLHREFVEEIDCSHINVVEMGQLTPEKAKRKYMEMKVQVVLVRQNWLASGNGDGSRRVRADDDDSVFSTDTASVELMDANDKANFLQGRSPSI